MGEFIYFTDEQKRMANEVDLEELLRQHGEKLIPTGRDKRLSSDHSITVRGNEWFDHATGEGGLAIDFVKKYFITLNPDCWQEDSYVTLCGVSGIAMLWMLEQNPSIRQVMLCLDNDKAGLLAAQRLSVELEAKGYHAELLLSEKKDWNEDLVQSEEERLQERSETYDMGFFC